MGRKEVECNGIILLVGSELYLEIQKHKVPKQPKNCTSASLLIFTKGCSSPILQVNTTEIRICAIDASLQGRLETYEMPMFSSFVLHIHSTMAVLYQSSHWVTEWARCGEEQERSYQIPVTCKIRVKLIIFLRRTFPPPIHEYSCFHTRHFTTHRLIVL